MSVAIESLPDLTLKTDLTSPASNSLGDKFGELMSRASLAAPQHMETGGLKVAREMAVRQTQSIDQAMANMESSMQLDGKSMSEITQASIGMMMQFTKLNCDMQLKTSLVDSSKQAAETLMKNQ